MDKKILEIETKIFYFRYQRKLFFHCLRKLDNHKARNIEDIQKIKKEAESYQDINPDPFVSDNLFFTISETDRVLAAVSKK